MRQHCADLYAISGLASAEVFRIVRRFDCVGAFKVLSLICFYGWFFAFGLLHFCGRLKVFFVELKRSERCARTSMRTLV